MGTVTGRFASKVENIVEVPRNAIFVDVDNPLPLVEQIGPQCDGGYWTPMEGWDWTHQGHDAFGKTDGEAGFGHISISWNGMEPMLEMGRVQRGTELLVFMQWGWVFHRDGLNATVSHLRAR